MIPKKIIDASLNFKTYDWPFKFIFLMVVFGQTSGIMFPELAHNLIYVDSMAITILFAGMGGCIFWGGVCTILSTTSIGSWKPLHTTKLPGWFWIEDILGIPVSIFAIYFSLKSLYNYTTIVSTTPLETALGVFVILILFIFGGSYLLSIPRRLPRDKQ